MLFISKRMCYDEIYRETEDCFTMSQEKVTRYKEEKVNRKKTMAKQKRARRIRNTVMAVVLVAALGWVGYSAVDYYITNPPRLNVEVDFTALDEYAETLNAEE